MSVAFETKASEKSWMELGVRVKASDDLDERTLRFVASTQSVDRDGDTINPRGIDTEHFRRNPVFTVFHNYNHLTAGRITNWEVNEVDGQESFVIDVHFPDPSELGVSSVEELSDQGKLALDIYRWYKAGLLNSVSIGFQPKPEQVERRDEGGFHFKSVELLEVAAVVVQSNRDAVQLLRDISGESRDRLVSFAKTVLDAHDSKGVGAVTKDIPAPPERFREQVKMGLKWHEEGFSGDGVEPDTIRQANALADGEVPSEDKIAKALSFFARHLAQDHDRRDDDGNPTPYLVALKLWGGEDEGPPYWRRAGRAAGMDVEKMWVREVLKAGQTLNAANRERTKQIIRTAAEMMASQGMDAKEVLAEMADEGKCAKRVTDDKDTHAPEDTKMITEDNVSDLMSMAVDLQSAVADMMQILHSDDPAAASDAFAGLLAESSDHVTGMSETFNEGMEEPEDDAEDEPEPPEQDAMDGEDEDEDKSPQSPPVEGGKDVDWDDVEIALTDQ